MIAMAANFGFFELWNLSIVFGHMQDFSPYVLPILSKGLWGGAVMWQGQLTWDAICWPRKIGAEMLLLTPYAGHPRLPIFPVHWMDVMWGYRTWDILRCHIPAEMLRLAPQMPQMSLLCSVREGGGRCDMTGHGASSSNWHVPEICFGTPLNALSQQGHLTFNKKAPPKKRVVHRTQHGEILPESFFGDDPCWVTPPPTPTPLTQHVHVQTCTYRLMMITLSVW